MVEPIDPGRVDLSVDIAGIRMSNPITVASGTFGSGKEYARLVDVRRLGAIVTKGVSLEPMEGNPPPRIFETASGMLNAIGLQNPGVERFAKEELPGTLGLGIPIVVNVLGETVAQYVSVVERLDKEPGIAGYELNISCPNVVAGGMVFGCSEAGAAQVVGAVKKATGRPVIAKLTPNVTDIVSIARACVEAGADALSLINTLKGMAIDTMTFKPKLANVTGGLSGPAIKPVAVRMVFEVARAVEVPLIGMGGVASAEDALELMLAGATAVAVGTATFSDPSTATQVIDGLRAALAARGIASARDVVGAVRLD